MQDKSKIAVYVAGPYSSDNVIGVQQNIRRGIDRAAELLGYGYTVYCPWLDFQLGMFGEYPVEFYQKNSMEWLRRSDCVLLTEGWLRSKGTQAEIGEATRLGIPVFTTLDELERWAVRRLSSSREGAKKDRPSQHTYNCECRAEEESVG